MVVCVCRYYGQAEISVTVPNINTEFMIGGYIIHPEQGLAIVNFPIRVMFIVYCIQIHTVSTHKK